MGVRRLPRALSFDHARKDTDCDMKRQAMLLMAMLLAACSASNAPDPAAQQAAAKAAAEARAAKDLALYEQMRSGGSLDIAATLGDELVRKYPDSAAAAKVRETLDGVREKAATQREARRLAKLWVYTAVPEGGGTQYAAAIESREPPAPGQRLRLVLREHPQWGRSVYLLLDDLKFDCSKGCATLAVRFDDAPAQRMKATIPPTGEPALFIDDDKAFIARLAKAKLVAIDATVKGSGPKTYEFEVSGYDASKLPAAMKK